MNDVGQTTQSRCPTRQELADFSAGKVAFVAADAIAAHVAECSRCQTVLNECDQDPDPIIADLRDSFRNSPVDEAEISRVVGQVEAIRISWTGASSETAGWEDQANPDGNITPQIRCPYCHEISSLADASPDETTVCPKCAGKFGVALSEVDKANAQIGDRVAHYELLELLGEGSFGWVWKARDSVLRRPVALKLPRRGQLRGKNIEVFLREARIAAQVRHPGIVHVYEVGVEKDTVYLASELIEGQSLDVCLTRHRHSAAEAARFCLAIAEAVQAAHAQGMVHRDLKPANILVDKSGQPHVADFGLARHSVIDVVVTVEGKILGTPVYMSPEQASGNLTEVDQRSDIYSMGVILYELLAGRPPFDGDIHVLVSKILLDDPTSPRVLNPSLPRDLETICLKCLEKKPGKRYQSARELATDLRLFLEGKAVHARPVTHVGRFWRWVRRKPVLASLSALALFLLASTIGALAVGHWRTTVAYREARRNLYFHSITSAQQRWMTNDPKAAGAILEQCPSDFQDFEWGHLKHLVRTPVRQLPEAGGVVAYSVDGNTLVTGGGPKYDLKVWDVQTDEELQRMHGHRDYAQVIDFHPTENLVVSAGRNDRTVRLWDVTTGSELHVFEGHERPVERCAFTPDGNGVVSCDVGGNVRVWDHASGELIRSASLELRRIRDIAFSPTARRFAVASRRGEQSSLVIYDYGENEVVAEVPTLDSTIGSLAYSWDGERLAVAEVRRAIRIWQLVPELRLLATIAGPVSEKCRVVFNETGTCVAAEALNGTICIWNLARGQMQLTLRGHYRPVYNIAFSPSGEQLAAGTGWNGVCIWDATTEQGSVVYKGGKSTVQDLAVSPNGKFLAAGFGDGSARIWDRVTGEVAHTFTENGDAVWSVTFTPDGERLAIAGEDRTVKIYDIMSGELKLEFTEHTRPLRSIVFSPNGEFAASAGLGNLILVWDPRTGRLCKTLRMERGTSVRALAFHPDSRRLATGGATPDVGLFDVGTGEVVWIKHWNIALRVWDLTFSPNGELLAIGRGDGGIRLRKTKDGTLVKRSGDLAKDMPIALAFSPNGQRLVSATARTAVSLWEPSSGRNVLTLSRRSSTAGAIAFLPGGQAVVTGDIDGSVRLWPTIDYQDAPIDDH